MRNWKGKKKLTPKGIKIKRLEEKKENKRVFQEGRVEREVNVSKLLSEPIL